MDIIRCRKCESEQVFDSLAAADAHWIVEHEAELPPSLWV